MRGIGVALAVLALGAPSGLHGQALQGRVVEIGQARPIATALVRLWNEDREPLSMTLADSLGRYLVEAPEPGRYFVSVERLGYETFMSHLLEMQDPDGVYPVDLEMRPDPVALSGLTVRAGRFDELLRRLTGLLGRNPRSLRVTPLMRPVLDDHLSQGHTLEDIVRWSNVPSITVKQTLEGPCFQYRMRGCMEVYLDGVRVNPELVEVLPLELAETMVILMPNESIVYEGGGIMLYTAAWIG